jgi:hypothetical protein
LRRTRRKRLEMHCLSLRVGLCLCLGSVCCLLLTGLVLSQQRLMLLSVTRGGARPHLQAWPGDDQPRRDARGTTRGLLGAAATSTSVAAGLGALAVVPSVSAIAVVAIGVALVIATGVALL